MTRLGLKGLAAAFFSASLLAVSSSARADSILNLGVTTGTFGETAPVQTSGMINGAQFTIGGLQPAGSGVLQSFLRIHSNGNDTFEQGYNTDAGRPLDDVGGGFTHSLRLLNDLKVSMIGGQSYYGFVLDVNQSNSLPDPYLSLVSFKIFQGDSGSLSSFNSTTRTFPASDAALTYDMGSTRVDINYQISSSGSGNADMFVFVPTAAFAGKGNYVYLYSAFGGNGAFPPYSQTDGYEEWATASAGGNPGGGGQDAGAPLPRTAWAGIGLLGMLAAGRFLHGRRQQVA